MIDKLAAWADYWGARKHEYVLLRSREDKNDPIAHCLIFGLKDRSMLLLEDNVLAAEIMQRMYEAGVPVLTKEQLPPGENIIEKTIDEMIAAGKSAREINAAIKAIKESRKDGNYLVE